MYTNNDKRSNIRAIALVAVTVLFAIIVSFSFNYIYSQFAPVYILLGVVALVAIFTWLEKPVWALYFVLFTVFLPTSLIPASINSYLNRIATITALMVWVIDMIRRKNRMILPTSTLFMLFFTGWISITLLWAENTGLGWNTIQRYVLRLILFLILLVNEIRTKKNLDRLMNTLALSGGLMATVGLFTVLSQGYLSGTRLQVLDVNQNALGLSLLIALPGVIWWASNPLKPPKIAKKSTAAVFLIVSIALIGFSGSRGSALSLMISLLAFLLWKPTRLWGIFGLIITGFAILSAPVIFSTTIARFFGTTGESFLGGRELIWPGGWQLIKDHLLLGVGVGNSSYQVIPYIINLGIRLLNIEEEAFHNPVLVIWAETGLIGLLLYLGVITSAIVSFAKQYFLSRFINDQYYKLYSALVASAFLGYMASWIKGGGTESEFSIFLMVALLLIPSILKIPSIEIPHDEKQNKTI